MFVVIHYVVPNKADEWNGHAALLVKYMNDQLLYMSLLGIGILINIIMTKSWFS